MPFNVPSLELPFFANLLILLVLARLFGEIMERFKQPAMIGEIGCVRELVPIANECGFYWGGHFGLDSNGKVIGRMDGMHFEIAKIIKTNL